jgi:hypothetical protein
MEILNGFLSVDNLTVSETFTKDSFVFELKNTDAFENLGVYDTFVNWIIGEFDLYLQNYKQKKLKVFFPNGCFSIKSFKNAEDQFDIVIKIKGKSKKGCENIMKKVVGVYNHVLNFKAIKEQVKFC